MSMGNLLGKVAYLFSGWTVHTTMFGHDVYLDPIRDQWRYENDGRLVGKSPRPCSKCGQLPTKEGYDPCMGYVPHAMSVCCGHGREPLLIVYRWGDVKYGDRIMSIEEFQKET